MPRRRLVQLTAVLRQNENGQLALTPLQAEILRVALRRDDFQNVLTIEELAAFLGASIRTIQRLDASGKGPRRILVNRRMVYPLKSLLEWCKNGPPLTPEPEPSFATKHLAGGTNTQT